MSDRIEELRKALQAAEDAAVHAYDAEGAAFANSKAEDVADDPVYDAAERAADAAEAAYLEAKAALEAAEREVRGE